VTEYEIREDKLELSVQGMDRLWALRSHLSIPLSDITEVVADPERGAEALAGMKVAGARIPGVLQAGTFTGGDGLVFWDVHRPGHAIVLSLQHEHYSKLVIDVEDPQAAVAEIRAALSR
jgi:tRNA A58 N-methylase Trm61